MPDVSPSEALNRLTRSKRDKKLADIVRTDAAQKAEDFDVLHASYEYVSDQWQAEHDRTHSILARLEKIADMPNGTAKNQLRRLLAEQSGQLFIPEPEPTGLTVDQLIDAANRIAREASL